MKGRVGGGGGRGNNGGAAADPLVCLPSSSRRHLTLMPKPICSPSRPTEPSKRRQSRSRCRGQASPLFRTKTKHMSSEIAEPTSPKVTCAGQIKVRSRPRPRGSRDKDWLSLVEEIERLRKHRKRSNWRETLSLKKEIMQFLGALRGLRFNMRCFGSFHGSVDCTTDEEDEDEEEEKEVDSSGSRNIFSKWFMVLEENQDHGYGKEVVEVKEEEERDGTFEEVAPPNSVPPPNALLLMRCRSAPAKGRLEEEEVTAKLIKEEEKEKERLVLMSYAPDFFKISTDIAKETWIVGSMDPLARNRSWKR
ncbi:uncharacterized protein LOC103707897 [Phoenix dactylifera]|uniref:Uncharacterized protein LOC103707897 n=1 Tax=Phoenix dactylifera TaxID=42345 RepID=A0A8B7C396_PHODC|nr:uncharacterized protein LOC103707897 [Phoenix dactylifera]